MRALAAQVKSGRNNGEYAGSLYCVGGQVGYIRCENTERDFDRAVVDAMFCAVDDYADRQPDRDANNGQVKKPQQTECEGGRHAADKQHQAEFECEQSAGIVEQALALQNVHQTFGKSNAFCNRGSGNGISGRDYSAEH